MFREVEALFVGESAAAIFGQHPIYYALFDVIRREWPHRPF
jgi:hypothetical protein